METDSRGEAVRVRREGRGQVPACAGSTGASTRGRGDWQVSAPHPMRRGHGGGTVGRGEGPEVAQIVQEHTEGWPANVSSWVAPQPRV